MGLGNYEDEFCRGCKQQVCSLFYVPALRESVCKTCRDKHACPECGSWTVQHAATCESSAFNKNEFSFERFKSFVNFAKERGYTFRTCVQYIDEGCPEKTFIVKHDLDAKPQTLRPLLDLEKELGIRSTIFARVTANEYNFMSYGVLPELLRAEREGFEIGLHTSFMEYSKINNLNPLDVLRVEVTLLKQFFSKFRGMSTHRDLNYMHNSLPFVEKHWEMISKQFNLDYQAYDKRIMNQCIYVNEGYSPHLCWRNYTPEQAIETGKNIALLTHPHWWWKNHPFELP